MNWSGLLFIGVGILLIVGSGKMAEYNRNVRDQEVAKSQKRLAQARGSALFARMQLRFNQSFLKAGSMDRVCFVAVGIATVSTGLFALFHPHGW